MAKEFAKKFYKSKEWKECRKGFIESVFGLCNRCGKPGYIVHHRKELTPININDPYVTLSWDNLEYLCLDCHNKEHHGKNQEVTREGFAFDEDGNLVQSPLNYL